MDKLKQVRALVEQAYASPKPQADPAISWTYEHHVLKVAELTQTLAEKYGANIEQAVAGALLHDIADVEMPRTAPGHQKQSLHIAKEILHKADFGWIETQVIIDQVIGPHDCDAVLPGSQEGKVMATADAMAYFTTDYYPYACWHHFEASDYAAFKTWVLQKTHHDFTNKIFFDDEREQLRPSYEAIHAFFSF